MAKFSLKLLGRFELSGPDGPVELPNKKLAALLAFLACSGPKPQSREKLATLLWGSHFEAQARQNLRQALHRLRRALGNDALVGGGDGISLAPEVVDSDVARLEALNGEGSHASLAAAAVLYQAPLLSDVNIAEETWSDWLSAERARLEGLALDAMIRHAEQALRQSGADGVMVGRGAYGRPWFVAQVIEWLRSRRRVADPSLASQYATLRAHYDATLLHYGNDVGVKIARKHLGWYSKGLPGSAEFRSAVNQSADPAAVHELIRRFYEPLIEREAA